MDRRPPVRTRILATSAAQCGADPLDRIKAAVGDKGFIADPAAMAPYLVEERGLYRGAARLVVRPAATAEVAEVVRLCAESADCRSIRRAAIPACAAAPCPTRTGAASC